MADPWAVQSVAAESSSDPWAVASVKPVGPAKKVAQPAKRSLAENVTGFMANVNRGLGIGDELAAAADTVANFAQGKPADYHASLAKQRQIEDQFAREKPKTAALARGTGMAATAAVPAGDAAAVFSSGVRGLNAATAVNAARGATTAAGQAALYAAADRGSASERLRAASQAARDPVTLALGAAGGAMATPKGPKRVKAVDPNVALLAEEGVQLTPGQMGGRTRKTAEDAATSLPFVGDAVAARRTEGVESFNKAVVNRALKPLGAKLPDDMAAGSGAVKYAGDLLSKGYEEAVPSRLVRADPGFADDVRSALSNIDTLTPDHRARLADILDQRVTSRLPPNGAMDGRLYKQIQSELDYEASRFSASTDADQRAIGEAIEGVQQALEGAARRQDPKFAARIDALDKGWAELGRIEAAAAKSQDLSGVFTPSQYGQSIRAADKRVRRRGVARGEALSQDLASAAIKVLPSKMPDSGTAGRAGWGMVASAPGAVLGAITGGGVGALAGIGGTAAGLSAASRLYTPKAVAAANVALSEHIAAGSRQAALTELARMAAENPEVAKLYREVAAKLSRAAGVAGGARAGAYGPPAGQP